MLSDKAVTKEDLTDIDKKQTRQIKQLRVTLAIAVAASFIINLCTTLILFYK